MRPAFVVPGGLATMLALRIVLPLGWPVSVLDFAPGAEQVAILSAVFVRMS